MATIDYGALLKVNGIFLNKNKELFMDKSDTGYVCKKAVYPNGTEINIDGNFYVYAGNKDLLLAFHKSGILVIKDHQILAAFSEHPFIMETHKDPNEVYPEITVRHLDPVVLRATYHFDEEEDTWEKYVQTNWLHATGHEKLSELFQGHKMYKRYLKRCKAIARVQKSSKLSSYHTHRYIVSWDINHNHYEVIFGYGIKNNEEIWKQVKNDDDYFFTSLEKKIIDSWF